MCNDVDVPRCFFLATNSKFVQIRKGGTMMCNDADAPLRKVFAANCIKEGGALPSLQ